MHTPCTHYAHAHEYTRLPSSAALRYAPKGDCFSRAKSFRCQLVKPTLGEREATQERRAAEERRVLRLPGLWRPLFVGRCSTIRFPTRLLRYQNPATTKRSEA